MAWGEGRCGPNFAAMQRNPEQIIEKAREWTGPLFDEATRKAAQLLMDEGGKNLEEAFYTDLEFGTGGLRGLMGVGTNRMNIYTIGMATQGLANYVKKSFPGQELKVAIAHDCRNNSPLFARTTAEVFAANGIKVYLFKELRPTPELSFAIRELGCHSGVVITASHNPKEYNGFKAYWNDGGQLVPPHDKNTIAEVNAITGPGKVLWKGNEHLIELINEPIDTAYVNMILGTCLSPKAVQKQANMPIVFTALHGTSVTMVPRVLTEMGFTNVHSVIEQAVPDGNFPTVKSPNPEEAAALDMALKLANQVGAELVMGCDPDSDRVGIAVRNNLGELELLNGNMTGSLLVYYLLRRWQENGKLNGRQFTAKTIVTTDLIARISQHFQVPCDEVLTGFKYIAELIREKEGQMEFVGGGEESYGYLSGDRVRDKDAIQACALIAEMAAWAKDKGLTLYDLLIDLYIEFGLYLEDLINVTKTGRDGIAEMNQMMDGYRNTPPVSLGGSKVLWLKDYKAQTAKNLLTGEVSSTGLPTSNVIQFVTADGAVVTARPSGTEPKIKFYISVNAPLTEKAQFVKVRNGLKTRIQTIRTELGL